MLRMGAADIRRRCHARQSQLAHEPLYSLAGDPIPQAAQVYPHLAAAVKQVPCVLGIDLRQQDQFLFVRFNSLARRIGDGTGDPRQLALQWIIAVDQHLL